MMRVELNSGRKEMGQETKGLWQDNTLSHTSTLVIYDAYGRALTLIK